MDKSDLKKLAILGITGGLLVASQVPAEAANNLSGSNVGSYLAGGNGCGGPGGCPGKHGANGKGNGATDAANGNGNGGDKASCGGKSGCGGKTDSTGSDSDQNESVSGSNNGQNFALLNHNDGELAESRLIAQLSKENLRNYRFMSYEGKQLSRRIALESGDPNRAVQLAEQQLNERRTNSNR